MNCCDTKITQITYLYFLRQIKFLGTQLIPGDINYFEEILQDVFSKQEHGFLIIDLLLTTLNELRLRTFDFKNKIAYVYIKN